MKIKRTISTSASLCDDCLDYIDGECLDPDCPIWRQLEAEKAKWTAAEFRHDREIDRKIEEK